MRISVVTPTLNQAAYIERTLDSVLSQAGDFELELIVVDGGSTDGTLEILERHRGRLSFTSERDSEQSYALNKGLAQATGDVTTWLNSDDTYLPGALARVGTSRRRRSMSASRATTSATARRGAGTCRRRSSRQRGERAG